MWLIDNCVYSLLGWVVLWYCWWLMIFEKWWSGWFWWKWMFLMERGYCVCYNSMVLSGFFIIIFVYYLCGFLFFSCELIDVMNFLEWSCFVVFVLVLIWLSGFCFLYIRLCCNGGYLWVNFGRFWFFNKYKV